MRGTLFAAFIVGFAATAAAQDDVQTRMSSWARALGVECMHCHVDGSWSDGSKPTFEFARRMNRMLDGLNAGPMKDVGSISCWTCHRGRAIPPRIPREAWEKVRSDNAAEFSNHPPNRALAMSVYAASLGVDCSFCHEADRRLDTKPAKAMVAKMVPIFTEIPKHFDKRSPSTQCYMCHQGQSKPERFEPSR